MITKWTALALLAAAPAFSQKSPVSLKFDGAQLQPSTSISRRNPVNQQQADANGFTVTFNWNRETDTRRPDGDGLRLFAIGGRLRLGDQGLVTHEGRILDGRVQVGSSGGTHENRI